MRFFLGALIACVCLGFASTPAIADDARVVGFIKYEDLKRDVDRAITESRLIQPTEPFFIIKEVELEIEGNLTAEGDFRIPVWAYVGAGQTVTETEKFSVVLVPDETALVGGDSLVDIAPMIKFLKKAFANENDAQTTATEIELSRKWRLQRRVEAGVDLIVMELGGEIEEESAQSVTFRLCPTIDMETCVGEE